MKTSTILLIGGGVFVGLWWLKRQAEPYLSAAGAVGGVVQNFQGVAGGIKDISSSVLNIANAFRGGQNVAGNAAPSLPSSQAPGIFGTGWGNFAVGGTKGFGEGAGALGWV